MNMCLILKYAYTGEVSMAMNRVDSFLEAAKLLEMFGVLENINKPKKKKKKSLKRKLPQVESRFTSKHKASDVLEQEVSKKFKENTSNNSDDSNNSEILPSINRKRARENSKEWSPPFKQVKSSLPYNRRCCHCLQDEKELTVNLSAHERNCEFRPAEVKIVDHDHDWFS